MSRMTLSDRIAIEAGIYAHKTLTEIAERIHKSRRHVSEELRKNGTKVSGEHPFGKTCHNATGCKRTGLCGKEGCSRRCRACREVDCQTICKAFQDQPCKQLRKPPYVCNVCTLRRKCKMDKVYYMAQQADAMAKRRYAKARSKPQIQGEELAALNALVTPLIKKGQPLTHIYAEHGAELPVSQRTLYNYIDSGQLSVGNLDLRRKVGYRPRKKKKEHNEAFLNQKFRQDRTYEDFLTYMARHPKATYVEEDILLLLNHINSTKRSKLGGKSPFELADSPEFQQLKAVMGLREIPADEVDLTPRLLKQK